MTSQPFIMPDPLPHDSASDDAWDEFDDEQSVHSGYRHYHSAPPSAGPSVGAFPRDASPEGPHRRRVQTPPPVARSEGEATRQPPSRATPSVAAGASPVEHPSQAENPHGRGQIAKAVIQLLSDDVTRACIYVEDALNAVFRLAKTPMVLLLLLTLVVFAHMSTTPAPARPSLAVAPSASPFQHLMDVHGRGLQLLADDAANGTALALDLSDARTATKDLSVSVRHSTLRSNKKLANMLLRFADDAQHVGVQLSRFGAAVNRAFDEVFAQTEFVHWDLQATHAQNAALPTIFRPFYDAQARANKAASEGFAQVADTLSVNMKQLLRIAEAAQLALAALDRQLWAIHTVATLELKSQHTAQDGVLASIWTELGAHRQELRQFDRHFELLAGVDAYRRTALDQVTRAVQVLQDMKADIDDMRDRVAAPALVRGVPLEVHLMSIKMGLQRLQRGRLSTVQGRATIGDA